MPSVSMASAVYYRINPGGRQVDPSRFIIHGRAEPLFNARRHLRLMLSHQHDQRIIWPFGNQMLHDGVPDETG